METGVHSSKDDGASAAADWACSSSWAGAWSTNDDWSGELWTPLPPNSSPAGPSASPGSPAHRKGQGVHAHPCLSGRWVGDPWLYIYIYNMQRGPRGTNSLAMGSDYRRSALQDANRELRLAKQCCRRRRSCRRRRCRGLAASSPQVQFYGVCAREVELLVIKLAVGDLVEREGREY